jgi:hypothetical protein
VRQNLPRVLRFLFASADNVVQIVQRACGMSNLESRHALDQAIVTGRGDVFLSLTEDQYAKLRIR